MGGLGQTPQTLRIERPTANFLLGSMQPARVRRHRIRLEGGAQPSGGALYRRVASMRLIRAIASARSIPREGFRARML